MNTMEKKKMEQEKRQYYMAVAKNEKWRNFWPDFYMHVECHKVHPLVHPLLVALRPPPKSESDSAV